METVILEKHQNFILLKGSNFGMMRLLVLTYAEIPFTQYDEEVLSDQLVLYDWLHLHRDFTGQYRKFSGPIEMFPGILRIRMRLRN
jgi:hypothetical protein